MDLKKIKAHSAIQRALGMIQGVATGLEPHNADMLEIAVGMIEDALEVMMKDD